MKDVSILDSLFRKRVWVLLHDGEIRKEVTKVVKGVRYISSFKWCGRWYRANEDGTFDDILHYQVYWSFSKNDILNKKEKLLSENRNSDRVDAYISGFASVSNVVSSSPKIPLSNLDNEI
jgi:hypothetical protein